MFSTKTIAAARRGVELAIGAFIAWLVQAYLAAGDITLTAAIDTVEANWDAAGGAALVALLGGFGYTRSRLKNLSPVAENQPVENANPDTDSNAGEGEQVA